MTGVAILHVSGFQVQHAHEQGDEHEGFVHLPDGFIDAVHDAVRQVLVGRYGAENGTGHRHEQGGGNTLAGYVANAEEELAVPEIEVEEVSSHFLGRRQGCVNLDVLAVRVGGKHLGQHSHLDLVGDVQVTLDGGLLCGGILQLANVPHQRLLHIAERVAQLADFVDAPQVRKLGVELAGRDGLGLIGQPPQGTELARNDADKEVQHEQQARQNDDHDGAAQAVEAAEDVALRANNGH